MTTVILGACKSCGQPHNNNKDTLEKEKGFCPGCVKKAKKLGAMAEITRRAKERNVTLNVIVDELIEYALDIQMKEYEDTRS